MSAYNAYKVIQKYKESCSALFCGVNYAYVVAPFLYDSTLSGFFKRLVFSLFYSTTINTFHQNEKDILIYYSCRNKKRPDYDYIPHNLNEILEFQCDYLETTEKVSVAQPFQTLLKLGRAYRLAKGYRSSILQRFCCVFLIAKYLTSTNTLRPLLHDRKKLVTFCDAQAPENLMAQLANSVSIQTFTTQHGQYRLLDSSNMSPDAEAYSNFISNYMFCWGEATRNEFVRAGFSSDKFIITGWIKQWGVIESCNCNCNKGSAIGVMLNGENSHDSNVLLIEAVKYIAGSLGLNYIVRLHPASKPGQYIDILDDRCKGINHYELAPYLQQVDFSIAHMTGAIIELLYAGLPVYLLDDEKLADVFRVEGLSFKSSDAIVSAVLEDSKNPEATKRRVNRLSDWFNSDRAKNEKIRTALLDKVN